MFEGGFLGLDNITVIDRGEPNSDGAVLEQSDATGWMGMFCLNLMRIALELARDNPVYEGMASKFLQHYVYVAYAMKNMGGRDVQLFDSEDGFFYDVLRYPDGSSQTFRVRSLVGLIPLFAVERLELEWIEPFKEFTANLNWFLKNRRHLVDSVIHPLERPDGKTTYLLTIVDTAQLRRLLGHAYDEREFLSRYGIRSLSKLHEAQPFEWGGRRVAYEPAESAEKLKGGNSNWRGPIWFPTSFLIIESLRKLGTAFGSRYLVETSGSGGQPIALQAIARDIARRMIDIFLLDKNQQAAGLRRCAEILRRPPLARSPAVLRVLPRRQRRRYRRKPPDGVDRTGRQPDRRVALSQQYRSDGALALTQRRPLVRFPDLAATTCRSGSQSNPRVPWSGRLLGALVG